MQKRQMKTLNPLSLSSVSTCHECPMLGQDHVPSEGNPLADVMIIGQSPGENEVKKHKPFCGPSGELVDFMLDEAELQRSEVYIANALKCHPPGNRKAMDGELDICKSIWLSKEIKSVDPRIILLLGKDAFEAVIPERRWSEWDKIRGSNNDYVVMESKKRNYLISYHPSYYLRRGEGLQFVLLGRTIRELLNNE